MSRYQFDCFYVSVLFFNASRFSWWLVYFEVVGRVLIWFDLIFSSYLPRKGGWEGNLLGDNRLWVWRTGSYPIQAVFESTVMLWLHHWILLYSDTWYRLIIYLKEGFEVILHVITLCCHDIYKYMFFDMLHQEYTLRYLQSIHSNRDEQWFDVSTSTWCSKTLSYTIMDILDYTMSSPARRNRYKTSLPRKQEVEVRSGWYTTTKLP
jgi:hypothetical protein